MRKLEGGNRRERIGRRLPAKPFYYSFFLFRLVKRFYTYQVTLRNTLHSLQPENAKKESIVFGSVDTLPVATKPFSNSKFTSDF